MGKPNQQADRTEQQALREGAAKLVQRRLNSRDKPWTPNLAGNSYQMAWKEISVFDPAMVAAQVRQQCAERGMPSVLVEQNVDGFAMRLTIPAETFAFHARASLENLRRLPEGKKRESIAGRL